MDVGNICSNFYSNVNGVSFRNTVSNPVWANPKINGVDAFIKTSSVVKSDNSGVSKKGYEFGKELLQIAQNPNFSYKDVQKLVDKYVPNKNIIVHPMSDYTKFGPTASRPEDVSAVTRPSFNLDGSIDKIDLFIPDLNSKNKEKFAEFIDKTTHEVTHAIQYDGMTKFPDSFIPDGPGKFMNYVEKKHVDTITRCAITECMKKLIIANNGSRKSVDEVNNFMDRPVDKPISAEELRSMANLPKDEKEFKHFVHTILYGKFFDNAMKSMKYDQNPDVKVLLNKYGSYENLREHFKEISKYRLKNEYEAWSTGIAIRKEILGTSGKSIYNDIIPEIFKMFSDAL